MFLIKHSLYASLIGNKNSLGNIIQVKDSVYYMYISGLIPKTPLIIYFMPASHKFVMKKWMGGNGRG